MKNSLKKPDHSLGKPLSRELSTSEREINAEGCFFDVDEAMIIRSWSPAMERFTHKPSSEVIGSEAGTLHPLLAEKIAAVLKSGRKRSIKDFRNDCLRGNVFSSEVALIPFKNEDGEIKGVHVAFSGLNGTCPIEQKLVESEKMIAIGKIASSLAHGVRNPLNAIKGAVVYLKEKYGREPTLLEFCSIITEEIEKLDSFISDFLSASSRGINPASVNVNGIIESILVMIKPRARIENIKIKRRLAVLPLISADAFQIEQAFFNVINNAMEAMSAGGMLSLKTSMRWENERDYVLIEIEDTGGGIPRRKMEKMGRLSDDRDRLDRGFGIFLAREVIKAHNGKLHWESVPDRGTTFRVYLPVKQDA